ncbi:hypothetical protein LAZ67_2004019 [Cordylochernes scorpioides]|uniref:Mos1 transposase HTH domain-containing protein n=1 Tax=Cordylochernes scorpioides TaxID=51811 RepID=A0ABY6K543_9ARAC|nr:hypothetical protein LAZ67_2004019 [Cordylochernes scorpioides]
MLTKGVRFHHDNARPHTAHKTTAFFEEFGWELVSHPPYSPNLASSDFHFLPELKKNLGGTQFQDDDELEEAVLGLLRGQAAEFFDSGFHKRESSRHFAPGGRNRLRLEPGGFGFGFGCNRGSISASGDFEAVPNMEADAFAADSNMSTDAAPPYPWEGPLLRSINQFGLHTPVVEGSHPNIRLQGRNTVESCRKILRGHEHHQGLPEVAGHVQEGGAVVTVHYEEQGLAAWSRGGIIHLGEFILRLSLQTLEHAEHVQGQLTELHLHIHWIGLMEQLAPPHVHQENNTHYCRGGVYYRRCIFLDTSKLYLVTAVAHNENLLQQQGAGRHLLQRGHGVWGETVGQHQWSGIHVQYIHQVVRLHPSLCLLQELRITKQECVRRRLPHLNEGLDFTKHQGPFQLILRFIGGSVVINLPGQLLQPSFIIIYSGVLDRLRFLPIKKKMDQRTCIKFCVKNEIKCADAFRMLTVAYGEATLDRSNVYRWYKMFSEGREDVNDEERAGRPSTSTTDEKINEVEKMILANRRITIREVAEDLNILIGLCHSIFINDLGMRRVAAKFVPKLHNCDQKQHRMNFANEMLDSVRNDPNLLQRVITGNEAWVYGYDVETKAQSSQWKLPHETRPKKARQVRSNVKVLLTVFFDCRGVVHHEFLPQGRTVNKEYYLQVMRNFREAIRQKRPDLWKNKNLLLHHDNAPAHTSLLVRDFLAKNNTLMMPQPPYSPDLAPCDFFLFPKLKRPMKGQRYATLDEIKTALKEKLKKIFKI